MLIDFMNRGIWGAQLDDLLANLGDEAAVAGAAGGGQLGGDARLCMNRVAHRVDQAAFFIAHGGEEGQAANRPHQVVVGRS